MGLEKFIEHALVREVEIVHYLLDRGIRIAEHIFGLKDDKRVNPVRCGPSAYILHQLAQIFRSKAKPLGIESEVPFLCVVL